MNRLEKAKEAIRNVHANTDESLDVVLDELQDLRDLAVELSEAVEYDIKEATT